MTLHTALPATPEALLDLLTAEVSGSLTPSREIAAHAKTGGLAAVLHEIDQTVLRRVLRFENAAGACVALEVSGRRLMRVVEIPGMSVDSAAEIDVAAAEGQTKLTDALTSFLDTEGALFVTTLSSENVSDAGLDGASVATLAALWDLAPVDPAKAIAAFVKEACELASAWLRTRGEVIEALDGDEDCVDALAAALAAINEQPAPDPSCMVLTSMADDSDLCVIIRFDETGAALRVDRGKMDALLAGWARHFR